MQQRIVAKGMQGEFKITTTTLADIAVVLFFSYPFINAVVHVICSMFGVESIENLLAFVLVYTPVLILCIVKSKNAIPIDVFFVLGGIAVFFMGTLLVHPEYIDWYTFEEYGALEYVFYPDEAIYAYLFVRLIADPSKVIKNMKISGWIMYIFFVYQIYVATQRGYWQGVSATSGTVKMPYSVSFGYNVMLYMIPFLYDALTHRRKSDILGAAIGLYMMLTNGSRGPMLFVGVFLVAYFLMHLQNSGKKWLVLSAMVIVVAMGYLFYNQLMAILADVLTSLNLSSRFIMKLIDGSIAEDNGRFPIWNAAIEMIREQPLGYGAFGSRPGIEPYVYAGYPHSVILEILIDFGVFVGGALLLFLFVNAYRVLFKKENQEWRGAFLIFFATACQLFISLCFWSSTGFWACIAVGVNCYSDRKRQKRILTANINSKQKQG